MIRCDEITGIKVYEKEMDIKYFKDGKENIISIPITETQSDYLAKEFNDLKLK